MTTKKHLSQRANHKPLMILASASTSRRQQLKTLSLDFKVEVSGIDEDIYKCPPTDCDLSTKKPLEGKVTTPPAGQVPLKTLSMGAIAQKIAQAKVEKVVQKYPKALVMGGDQMACLGDQIFNKPVTSQKAIQTLGQLQGKTHILFTALHIRYGKKSFSHLEVNKMTMRSLSKNQITAYVQKAQPLECAGAYALERGGLCLFEKIDTKDQSAVIGFPLITLLNQLVRLGVPLPFLTLNPRG